MLIKWFINHQWKQAKRSQIFQKNLIVNIFLGFIVLLLFLEFLVGGIVLGNKWHEIFPDTHPVTKFNSFLLYYFAFDIIIRFFLQSLPVLKIQPYLHLPIKKSSIINYLLAKAFLNVFNFLPLLILIPIAIFQVAGNYSSYEAWVWIISLFFLVLTMNYLMVYMKKQLVGKPMVVGIFGLVILALAMLDRFEIFAISDISASIFDAIILNPILIIVPTALLIFVYYLNFSFLKGHMYPEEMHIKKSKKVDTISDFKYLKSFGQTGEMMGLDLKLIWRHKRTKSIVYMLPIFLLYGLFFYPNPQFKDSTSFKIFVGWFVTGGMMLNYLNYAFSYESNYFDAILAHNIDMRRYFRMKLTMGMLISSFCYVVTIPYLYFGLDILLINTTMFIYNIGILSFILLYMATFNKNRMDLSKGAAFNYQGLGASNWLAMLPAMLLPIGLYHLFAFFDLPMFGIAVIGVLGLIGLLFSKSIMEILVHQFEKRKYIMAEGFRKK